MDTLAAAGWYCGLPWNPTTKEHLIDNWPIVHESTLA